MKLVVCVAHNRDKGRLTEELVKAGFKFTYIGSTGGFLREGNSTYVIGAEDDEVDALLAVVGSICHAREQMVNVAPIESSGAALFSAPIKVPVGGAVAFVLPVERFERF